MATSSPTASVGFSSSFDYWTDSAPDGTPQMIDPRGKVHPAPWVPFTRAGCDVGAFSMANIEFENVFGDINNVFGPNSFEAMEANSNFDKAVADFEGIAVHCARNSKVCGTAGAPDLLLDEPGGYRASARCTVISSWRRRSTDGPEPRQRHRWQSDQRRQRQRGVSGIRSVGIADTRLRGADARGGRTGRVRLHRRRTRQPLHLLGQLRTGRGRLRRAAGRRTTRPSASSSRACRPMASRRTTHCSSSPPTRTITSPVSLAHRLAATASHALHLHSPAGGLRWRYRPLHQHQPR